MKQNAKIKANEIQLKRTLFKDGIRYSIDMTYLAFSRLKDDLALLSKSSIAERDKKQSLITKEGEVVIGLSVVSHTWQVIDSVNRLRELLRLAPGIKKQDSEYKLFFKCTQCVENLRDNVQHMNSQIAEYTKQNIPVWGTINWVCKFGKNDVFHLFSLVPGEIFGRRTPLINPIGKSITLPIGLITVACDTEVCISEIVENQIARISTWLEKKQGFNFGEPPQSMLGLVDFKPEKPESNKRT
jgi:hypothetical protein